jgi:hypothetical protein
VLFWSPKKGRTRLGCDCPTNPRGGDERFAAHDSLIAEASRLVDEHGPAIEALAKSVLDQPWTARPEDTERQWSTDTVENAAAPSLPKYFLLAQTPQNNAVGLLV